MKTTYGHYLFNAEEIAEIIEQINDSDEEIIATYYLADSGQVCIIVNRKDSKLIVPEEDKDGWLKLMPGGDET